MLTDPTRNSRSIINALNTTAYQNIDFGISQKISRDYSNLIKNLAFPPSSVIEETNLASEIAKLRSEIAKKSKQIAELSSDAANKEEKLASLTEDFNRLKEAESIAHLLNRVGEQGKFLIKNDESFRNQFRSGTPCDAFVLSIDIRKSTELMLKAADPRLYAQFILGLVINLRECVLKNFGVFDKFTGDGILGFFPDFYSGKDSGYFAVKTATECHDLFSMHYNENMYIFNSVLLETGLGIGLDFGKVQIVDIGSEITVVGAPVVYACRMSGAKAGHTFVNYPAFTKLNSGYDTFTFQRQEINIKHEGNSLAYSVTLNGKPHEIIPPEWYKNQEG
jgi:class 3 adenylate cyclase